MRHTCIALEQGIGRNGESGAKSGLPKTAMALAMSVIIAHSNDLPPGF